MLLLEKITHSYLCYKLDKHSVLKPFVTYSSPSTPYSINTLVLHQPYSIPFFKMKCAFMIPRIVRAIPCYRHYIHRPIFWKLISLTNLFAQFSIYNLYKHSSQGTSPSAEKKPGAVLVYRYTREFLLFSYP